MKVDFVIDVVDLSKSYGSVSALSDVSFGVFRGDFFGVLGPNGAGKTTLIKILTTLALPSSGSVKLFGKDVVFYDDFVRNRIGVVFQENVFDEDLSGWENLFVQGKLYGLSNSLIESRVFKLVKDFDIVNRLHFPVRTYSGGMLRQLELVRGLLSDPEILFLDEPTTGLDPNARRMIWDLLLVLKKKGVTIVMTTHYMEEADFLCDRVAIVDRGAIVALDSVIALKDSLANRVLKVSHSNPDLFSSFLKKKKVEFDVVKGVFLVNVSDIVLVNEIIGSSVLKKGLLDFSFHRPTLDDVFIHFVGRNLNENI
ncbi:ATP-binding cassette domain-containing protein [Candidatus Woesearchaeota archaeon]|nr:ATP-binding cassette domain-containing protein [Candidatus Woesearchaeota archaeon]